MCGGIEFVSHPLALCKFCPKMHHTCGVPHRNLTGLHSQTNLPSAVWCCCHQHHTEAPWKSSVSRSEGFSSARLMFEQWQKCAQGCFFLPQLPSWECAFSNVEVGCFKVLLKERVWWSAKSLISGRVYHFFMSRVGQKKRSVKRCTKFLWYAGFRSSVRLDAVPMTGSQSTKERLICVWQIVKRKIVIIVVQVE